MKLEHHNQISLHLIQTQTRSHSQTSASDHNFRFDTSCILHHDAVRFCCEWFAASIYIYLLLFLSKNLKWNTSVIFPSVSFPEKKDINYKKFPGSKQTCWGSARSHCNKCARNLATPNASLFNRRSASGGPFIIQVPHPSSMHHRSRTINLNASLTDC